MFNRSLNCVLGLHYLLFLGFDGHWNRVQVRVAGDKGVPAEQRKHGTPQHDRKVLLGVGLVQWDHVQQVGDDTQEEHDGRPVKVLAHEHTKAEQCAQEQAQGSQKHASV